MPDFKNMEAVEAIRTAKDASGMTVEEISLVSGVPAETIRRWLRRDTQRCEMGLSRIPDFCSAVGNMILLQWIEAQLEREPIDVPPAKTRAEVLTAVSRIAASLGDVQRVLADSGAAGIDPACAREIRGLLREVIEDSRFAMATLAALAGKRGRADGALFSKRRPGLLARCRATVTGMFGPWRSN